MPILYTKVKVTQVSIGMYEEMDNSLHDNGFASDENYGLQDQELMLKSLTARQREVVKLLSEGYSRIEIGEQLSPSVCTQAVHQIVLRIRKRLEKKVGVSTKGWKSRHRAY